MKRPPWMKFYPADWRADPALRACSPAARSVWLDMIGLMHEAEPYGHLLINGAAPPIKTLSGLFNVHHKTLIACLKELSEHGVYSTTDAGIIYSRRMVRDHEKAIQDQENGRRGGNPRITAESASGVNPQLNRQDKAQKPEARSQKETTTLRSVVSPELPLVAPKATKRSRVDADLLMTDGARSFAAGRGFLNGNAEALWERFTAHHAAKGTQFANIEAGWRTWVLNEIKFNGERHVEPSSFAGRSERPRSGVEAILSDIGRKPG